MVTTTGVHGTGWRADVSPSGGVRPHGAPVDVQWYVAAADRWHAPGREASVRQRRLEGTAVVETRMRIPGGDAVQTVYSVADDGGWTVIEVANDSASPIAVAFDSDLVVSTRPPSTVPVAGLDLPASSRVFPVGHHAVVRVGIRHRGRAETLPGGLPGPDAVVRGWLAAAGRAGRFAIPDAQLADAVVAERCEVLLGACGDPGDDPVGFLVAAGQAVRLGEPAEPLVPDVAAAVERVARRRSGSWDVAAAYDGAGEVLATAGEARALDDLVEVRRHCPPVVPPAAAPCGLPAVAWLEQTFASSGGVLFAGGWPAAWSGHDVEVHGVPVGPRRRLSYAVRWHGDRPAVIWELEGDPLPLSSPVLAPGWSTDQPRGEVLWPATVGAPR